MTRYQATSNTLGIAECIESLALIAHIQGEWKRAARLLGAAASLREMIGAPLPLVDRIAIEDITAATRAALGMEPFTAAWTAGQAMSLEQACGEASADTTTADRVN